MIKIRKSEDRGHANHGWLDALHSFSFGSYHDPEHMGFSELRVINQDRIAAAQGFGTHGHRDMEIVTYVLSGVLEHKDSMGNGSTILPGEVQLMSAGTGVSHSEFNASKEESLRLLQIWFHPAERGTEPGYEERHFTPEQRRNALRLIASPDGREGSVRVGQDVDLFATLLAPGEEVHHGLAPRRHAWIQVARGEVRLEVGERTLHLREGDGASISEESGLTLIGEADAEVLVFDLA